MDINEPIQYFWKWGWAGMSEGKPIVNRLLKAMLDHDVVEINRLFSRGARLSKCNQDTLGRCLFIVMDDYDVIKTLIDHGFSALYYDSEFSEEDTCYDGEGYCWGYPGRAWYLQAYKVFELLVQNGFKNMSFFSKGEVYSVDRVIFKKNDVNIAKILLENGYSRKEMERFAEKNPNSKVSLFLEKNPLVPRKTIAISDYKYREYPKPEIVKPGILFRKMIQQENELLLADYNDFISTQKKYIESIGYETWVQTVAEIDSRRTDLAKLMIEMADLS